MFYKAATTAIVGVGVGVGVGSAVGSHKKYEREMAEIMNEKSLLIEENEFLRAEVEYLQGKISVLNKRNEAALVIQNAWNRYLFVDALG